MKYEGPYFGFVLSFDVIYNTGIDHIKAKDFDFPDEQPATLLTSPNLDLDPYCNTDKLIEKIAKVAIKNYIKVHEDEGLDLHDGDSLTFLASGEVSSTVGKLNVILSGSYGTCTREGVRAWQGMISLFEENNDDPSE